MMGAVEPRTVPAGLCVMVMGPSGVGKSTFAHALADRIGAVFIEGDDYHPAENQAAMSAGRALTDEMRMPWLSALSEAVKASCVARPTVFTCSALKRSYRDFLRERIGPLRLIMLQAPPELIRKRMSERQHFMPPALLDSQISTLQPPLPNERAICLDMSDPLEDVTQRAMAALLQAKA